MAGGRRVDDGESAVDQQEPAPGGMMVSAAVGAAVREPVVKTGHEPVAIGEGLAA
jgi:hypothetical protein